MDHPLRRTNLIERLPEGVDAMLVTGLPNVRYLTGFTGSNAQAVVGASGSVFFTDGRYTEQSRHEVPDLERVTYKSSGWARALLDRCGSLGITKLGFESQQLSVKSWRDLTSKLEGIELVSTEDLVEQLRWVKEPEEVSSIERAQDATDAAFEEILDRVSVGMTERQLARTLEDAMFRAGADGLSFETIAAFGENAAEPHHEPTHRALREGDAIKLDFGAMWGGYHTDMTRTIAFGQAPAELRKIHDVVREAQQAGIDAVRPGAVCKEVDALVRNVISDAGFEPYDHGLGHGVGLEIHEGPGLTASSEEVLPVGAVVTVEPGIYVAGLGGVRIEDVVEVTPDGCRALPDSTRELIEL